MGVSPDSKAAIHDKFQRMKTIREIAINNDIIDFLEKAHADMYDQYQIQLATLVKISGLT